MKRFAGTLLIASLALVACGGHSSPRSSPPSDSDLCHRADSMLIGYVLIDNPGATYVNPTLRADVAELARTLKAQAGWEAPLGKVEADCHTLYPLPRISFFDVTATGTP